MSEVKTSEINIKVTLGDHQVPEKITWSAPDQNKFDQPAKAMLLSLFDQDSRDTLKIDLWTKEFQVVEMDRFMYQTLRSMSETYFKATSNHELSKALQQFVQFFGEQTEIIPRQP
ncbi:MAG: gliding motility protein GldC [Saprospiraceae bacterium]|nr:gliding motility protein GldC [Saprospiraceae bacterium]